MDKSIQSTMGPPAMPAPSAKGRSRPRRTTADDQIDRKRELDRIAQRMSRERTRNRIIFLEQKLKSLEARDRGGQISYLMKVIEDLRRENTQLRASLMKIRFIADDLAEPSSKTNAKTQIEENGSQSTSCTSSPQELEIETINGNNVINIPNDMISEVEASSQDLEITRNHFQPSTSTAFTANGFSSNTPNPTTSGQPNIAGNYAGYDATFLSEFANFEATMASWSNPGFDWDFTNASGPLPLAADVEKWNVSDSAFLQALELCRTTTNKDPVLDPDVPVKAILWGWHTVDAAQRQHPVWQALKQVDERVFGAWTSKAQKIAMMYVCQLGLQYRASPTKENLQAVPPWFRPSQSQERIAHPLVIDFLIWPGLREHLVYEHNHYAPNAEFSRRFCEDLRFNWPYADHEIFSFDAIRNRYTFSRRFKQSACDLKNWTMDQRFFETFQELVGNVNMSRDSDFVQIPTMAPAGSTMPGMQGLGPQGFPPGSRLQAV